LDCKNFKTADQFSEGIISNQLEKVHETSPLHKGICRKCSRDITTDSLSAMGALFHVECWCCTKCRKQLGYGDYFEHESNPWCQNCHETSFLPVCKKCNQSISGQYTEAFGIKYHPQHFECVGCSRVLEGGIYFPKNNQPWCQACIKSKFEVIK